MSSMSAAMTSTPFVGRAEERAFLLSSLERGLADTMDAVLIEGEAGIGKSRLLAEARTAVPGFAVRLDVAALEYVREPGLPFFFALERWCERSHVERGPLRDAVAALDPARTADKGARVRALRMSCRSLLERGPLAIFFEDVHWADVTSLDLLRFLVEDLRDAQAFVAATTRPVAEPGRMGALDALGRSMQRVRLRPLSDREIVELLRESIRGGSGVAAERLRAIARLAEGNPLYAEELLRRALEGRTDDEVPAFAASLAERLTALPETVRSAVHCAAALDSSDIRMVAGILERSEADIDAALARAAELGLLVADGSTWRFAHALVRNAVAAATAPSQRRALHARICAYLETHAHPPDRSALAYHAWMAGDRARTIHYNEAAGERSFTLQEFGDSVRAFERALASEPEDAATRARLCAKLGRAHLFDGVATSAQPLLSEAHATYAALEDRYRTAEVELSLSLLAWNAGDRDGALQIAQDGFSRIAELTPSPLHFDLALRLARIRLLDGKIQDAREALAFAEKFAPVATPRSLIPYHNAQGMLCAEAWDAEGCIAAYRAALAVAAGEHDMELTVSTLNNFGLNAVLLGRYDVAEQQFDQALERAYEFGMRWHVSTTALSYARAAWLAGDLLKARRLFGDALASTAEAPGLRVVHAAYGIPIAVALGDDALLRRCAQPDALEEALQRGDGDAIGGTVAAFADAYLAQGRRDEIPQLLHRALEAMRADARPLYLAPYIAEFGERSDAAKAPALVEAPSHDLVRAAERELCWAFLERRRGRRREAAAAGTRAAALYERLGRPLWRARALVPAGRRIEALTIFRRQGDAGSLRRFASDAAAPEQSRLTPREREVAELAGAGRSNRDIGLLLGLSVRTVENHVQSAFNRLGVNTRAELGRALWEGRTE